jgi:two-component system cell cycle sensor histidine kinase/response regulator CckA
VPAAEVAPTASTFVALLGADGRPSWMQPEAAVVCGRTLPELAADADFPASALVAEDRPAVRAALTSVATMPAGATVVLEATLQHGAGPRRRAALRLDATGGHGTLLTVTLGHVDQAEFLRRVIDVDPNFVFVKDRDGRFVLTNQALADAYGVRVDQLEGRTDADFTNATEAARFRADDRRVLEDNIELVIPEEPITHAAKGVRWLMTVKRPMLGVDGRPKYLLGIATDITARRQAEAERRRLDEQLRQTQQLESLGLLAAGVAHDFNNLLTVILGNTNLALRRSQADAAIAPLLQQIEAATERAADLCRQMMDYAGAGRGQAELVDLADLVTATSRLLELPIGRQGRLALKLTPGLPPVRADATQLRQVVMNLVLNAAEAMAQRDGVITIGARVGRPPPALLAELAPTAPGEGPGAVFVALSVADQGTGMSAETRARIFEPFYTTKFTGRGLGLASVRGIVQAHGGAIEVTSALGEGATFTVWLPAAQTPERPAE